MKKVFLTFVLAATLTLVQCPRPWAGSDDPVDIHGFVSQGYLKSDANNFLAETEEGSFEFNEMGINFGSQMADDLHIGMQFFARDLGELGNDEVVLDWAFADYRWRDYLGLRVGMIKIPIAFYSETRDADMLRTSIFLPQGTYNEGWRDTFTSLKGAGLYGELPLSSVGSLSYIGEYGMISPRRDDGMSRYLNGLSGFTLTEYKEVDYGYGAALIWNTFIPGLRVGCNIVGFKYLAGVEAAGQVLDLCADVYSLSASTEFTCGDLVLASEYSRNIADFYVKNSVLGIYLWEPALLKMDGWYVSGVYRLFKWIEIGLYYTEYYPNADDRDGVDIPTGLFNPLPASFAWFKDWALSFRFDLNENWTLKFEGHTVDGTAVMFPQDQENILESERYWNLLAVKITYNF